MGGRGELKPPPSPSLCAVPLEKVFLFQTKLWLFYFNKEKALEILYNIHHMTKNESRYRLSLYFEWSITTFLNFVGCFRPKTKWVNEIYWALHYYLPYEDSPPKYLQIDNGYEIMAEIIKKLCSSSWSLRWYIEDSTI